MRNEAGLPTPRSSRSGSPKVANSNAYPMFLTDSNVYPPPTHFGEVLFLMCTLLFTLHTPYPTFHFRWPGPVCKDFAVNLIRSEMNLVIPCSNWGGSHQWFHAQFRLARVCKGLVATSFWHESGDSLFQLGRITPMVSRPISACTCLAITPLNSFEFRVMWPVPPKRLLTDDVT